MFITLITIFAYLAAAGVQLLLWMGRLKRGRALFLLVGALAVITHGFLLHHWIDIGTGQNLAFFNMLSLVLWLVSVLVLISALRKPVENLGIFIFPWAALSIVLVLTFPAHEVINTAAKPRELVHILLSVLTLSVLCVAALQSILLVILDHGLRGRTLGLIQQLPPLELMEKLLFQMIFVGFILLTLVIISGFYLWQLMLDRHLLLKTVLVIFAWIVFAVLLWGRCFLGWRGRRAIHYTLVGVILLIIAYFGNKLALEFIL